MFFANEPISNFEQAKRYYIAMGCSHFYLDREDFQRRDEYYALKISPETEKCWKREEIERQFAEFSFNNLKNIGLSFSSLNDMIDLCGDDLKRMLSLANSIYSGASRESIRLILQAVVGNKDSKAHGGLIEKAFKFGLHELTIGFVECAKIYIEKAEKKHLSLPFIRGYFADDIESFAIQKDSAYIDWLRKKDDSVNFRYYKRGADRGNIFSMRMLAKCYIDGKGCNVNYTKAEYWLSRATDLGNALAKDDLLELRKHKKS